MIFRVGAERSRRRSVHKVHDCDENREGNNTENSAVKGIHECGENNESNPPHLKIIRCGYMLRFFNLLSIT
ncbi:MAG: hypothetical protein U1E78_13495 [Gammaproteobacteria bacterium]